MQSNVLIARASGDWQRSTTTSSAATTAAATINNRTNTLHQQQRRNMELCGSPVRDLQASLFPPIVTRSLATVMGDLLAVSPPSPLPPHSLRSMSQPPIIVPERMREPPPQLGSMAAAQPARWPVECQVLNEKVHHLEYTPPSPEPYYEPTNDEPQPQPVGNEAGTLVFEYHPISPVSYFTRSTVGGSRPVTPQPQGDYDGLRFESRFESGNLARAVRITPSYYELHVRADMYTNRHQQWFYFRISNTRRCTPYRLSIVNLAKAESLYNEGMKPLLYSTRDAQLHSIGWRRCGYNIAYYQNGCSCNDGDESPTYTLTFTVEFPHDKDEVYISHCYPYTYTDLQEYLNRIATHPIKSTYSTLRLLCRSLAGNNVYYLTVTSPPNILPHDSTGSPPPKTKKRSIVLTARVHPGETPSSWMMKGMIDFLTGDSNQARELRDKFIFKLVPMLNPDGVIVGNNRCSLTGRDLNRQYRTVIRETYPSVWHTKLMIRRLIEECGVAMYCDLHAHSRKHNIFIYGCESRRNSERRLQEQVFPLMLHKNSADKFSFEDCKFRIHRSKEGTGRVVVWLLGVANSYTLEASFGGSQLAGRAATHFTTQDYEAVGRSFCETLLDFSDDHPSKVFSDCPSHIREFIDRLLPNELLEKLRLKIISKLLKGGSSADEPTNITLSDYSSEEGDTSSSESDERNEPIQCCVSLQAPPPSPMPPKRHPRKNKIKNKPVRSPKLQREILPTLDWPTTDPGSDFYDSADERLGVSPPAKHIGRIRTRYGGDGYRSDWGMPPELTVISGNGGPIRQRSQSVIDITLTDKQSKPSWHRIRSLPPSRTLKPQPAEVEVKLTSLRQRIWTGMGIGTDSPISWGMSVLAATAYQNDCEALLRSCSQKLFAFKKQNGDLRKDSDGHKKVKKKSKVIKAPIVIDENNILKPKTSKKKLQKLTRQKTISEVRPDPPKFERPPVRQKTIAEMKLDPIKFERIPIRPSTSGPASTGKLKKQRTVLQSQEKESDNEDTSAKRTVKKKKKRKKT